MSLSKHKQKKKLARAKKINKKSNRASNEQVGWGWGKGVEGKIKAQEKLK